MLSKTSKNAATVIFKCINVVDKQRFDISVIQRSKDTDYTSFAHLKHKYIVPSKFYEVSDEVVVQVSQGGICDLGTAMRRNKIVFNELTVRAMLHNILRALSYCEKTITKPFRITLNDIIMFKVINVTSANTWLFKLKNCFYENQNSEMIQQIPRWLNSPMPRECFLANESIVNALIELSSIVLTATKNIHGYNSPLELLNNCAYSSSLRYVVNSMLHYRSMRAPPTLKQLLLFFQTTTELHTEKLRSALFARINIKREMPGASSNFTDRSKSCFF